MTNELFEALKTGDWFRLSGGNTIFRKVNETQAVEFKGRHKLTLTISPVVMVTWIPNLSSR